MQICLATRNVHKVEEFRALVPNNWKVKAARDFGDITWEETGTTFLDNARIKVSALLTHLPPGWFALGDDSGLEVDALGGAPGVYSARYAGKDGDDWANNQKLLRELADVALGLRTARFVCQLVLQAKGSPELAVSGTCEGEIISNFRGSAGFGYDPLFVPKGYDKTLAELGADVKNQISHRGKAFQGLLDALNR